ncbi:hypothetical protein FDB92_20245 [Clostridium butyricum]|uniref:MobV family relaxase n=1 Tax=Clostridium butyricum TaxID=1492 RepID=UPI0013CCCB04|nr:MobV family relaxase [Clostridium butyricum]NFL33450.1 hypothetical protein [Clostridium butyricum]
MAHVEKYTRSALGHMTKHYERAKDEKGQYVNFGNENIDLNKTELNYNLAPEKSINAYQFINEKCTELNCLKRKDVNVMCDWVVTMPKDLSAEHEESFFKNTYDFLEDRYGKNNVVSAYVHKDEITPHMHFSFVPVVYDEKKDRYKISAKERVNRVDLKTFHRDLDKYLEQSMGFKVNVLNEMTKEGNKSIEELKRGSAIDKLKEIEEQLKGIRYQLEPLKAEYEAKKAYIMQAEKDSDVSVMYPDYAVISKKGLIKKEEYVTVPKEKWESKHVAANHVNALSREYREIEDMIKDFKNTSEELKDIKKFKKENNSLKYENMELKQKLERTQRLFNQVLERNPKIKEDLEKQVLKRSVNRGMER